MEDRLRRIAERARLAPTRRIEPVGDAMPMRPIPIDPAAIADAMLAGRRLSRTVERAREPDDAHVREWEVEARGGESILQAMERTIAESMPPAVAVTRTASMSDLRSAFLALTPDERADEVARHLWATKDPTRARTIYSPLLCAMGVGASA